MDQLMKLLGVALLFVGLSGLAVAGACQWGCPTVPEIDPSSGGSALALLSGSLLMFRGRRKK